MHLYISTKLPWVGGSVSGNEGPNKKKGNQITAI